MPEITISWTLKDMHKSTWDLSKKTHRDDLGRLLGVDLQGDEDADTHTLIQAVTGLDRDPGYDIQDAFADISGRGTWFDRDPGDCVEIFDVKTG